MLHICEIHINKVRVVLRRVNPIAQHWRILKVIPYIISFMVPYINPLQQVTSGL